MINVQEITDLHAHTVALWHRQDVANPYSGLLQLVCEQHSFNYLLWHEEDVARSPNVGDARIAQVKRAIDGYNQKRNDGIEKLDAFEARRILPANARRSEGPTATRSPSEHRNARQRRRPAVYPVATSLSHAGAG
jgi:hypothetical protein